MEIFSSAEHRELFDQHRFNRSNGELVNKNEMTAKLYASSVAVLNWTPALLSHCYWQFLNLLLLSSSKITWGNRRVNELHSPFSNLKHRKSHGKCRLPLYDWHEGPWMYAKSWENRLSIGTSCTIYNHLGMNQNLWNTVFLLVNIHRDELFLGWTEGPDVTSWQPGLHLEKSKQTHTR